MRNVLELIEAITGMGVIVAINLDEDYWFVDVLDENYQLTGIQEFSITLVSALERIEARLLSE